MIDKLTKLWGNAACHKQYICFSLSKEDGGAGQRSGRPIDFKPFYYQVNLTKKHLMKIVQQYTSGAEREIPEKYLALVEPLTDFVWQVIETYSWRLHELNPALTEGRSVLPIGFPPSNVLANYCLKKFDDTFFAGGRACLPTRRLF